MANTVASDLTQLRSEAEVEAIFQRLNAEIALPNFSLVG